MAKRRKIGSTDAKERLNRAEELWDWVPHRTQREWLLDEHKVKVAACGRRWGKTEAAAYDAATFAIANPESVQMIVSPTYDQSRLIFRTVEKLIFDREDLKKGAKCVRTPYPLLTLENGSVISARTADEDGRNLRGHSADRVIVDEAAYVRDEVIEEVISPMLADRDGYLILISTPFGRNHFYEAFVRGETENPRYKSFRFRSTENPHINGDYIEEQREYLTERQFAVEYEAQFIDDQNAVFPWVDIEAAVAAGCRVSGAGCQEMSGTDTRNLKPDTWFVAGVDWARYQDYTAVVVMDAGVSPYRVTHIERFNHLPWELQIERVEDTLRTKNVRAVCMDRTSVGDPLFEQLDNKLKEIEAGISVDGCVFTNQSKREVIDRLAIVLSHRRITIPNDERLIKELQYYEYEITESGNMRMNAKRGYTDDLVIALALAVQSAKTASGESRVISGGDRYFRTAD